MTSLAAHYITVLTGAGIRAELGDFNRGRLDRDKAGSAAATKGL
jgi:hypothetical protein